VAEIGYALSSEEHGPRELIRYAAGAEAAGFPFALISDHFHPWIDRQGHSPFVWSVIGGIAERTERLRLGTGVTAPIIRTHPAIVAHAAATCAAMMPGRFFLGVGTGENLNEHVLGDRWPSIDQRIDMLEEAIEVIRLLWSGDQETHRGRYYTVEQARLYDVPDERPPIMVAAKGDRATALAAQAGDGLIGLAPDQEMIEAFEKEGGAGKPKIGQVHVCWAEDEKDARATALEWWPNTAVPGELTVDLPLPRHFEQAAERVDEDAVAESVVCGPDRDRHVQAIREFLEAGYDQVYVHQVGPDQEGFLSFYRDEVLTTLERD
jgi:coenzyme F420-dependent glucose-6-phosphate dehydrogenase